MSFKCDVCGKEFITDKSLRCHRALHYRKGGILERKKETQDDLSDEFKCGKCGKKFKSKVALQHHKIHCNNRNIICPICKKEFDSIGFTVHYRHCEKEEKKFEGLTEDKQYIVCKICGKKAFHLKKHVKAEHNISVDDYKKQFPGAKIVADDIEEKARQSYNEKFGAPTRGAAFPNDPMNKCEKIIDDITPKNVIYSNSKYYPCYIDKESGKRIVRNPDFIVVDEDYTDIIRKELENNNKLSKESKKHIKKVIEHFGNYWHGENKTGKKNEIHEAEVIEDYKKMGKECLVIWEKELKQNIELVKEKIENFIE